LAHLATAIGGPLSVAIGWAHLKRGMLFTSEQDIAYEASPYVYKLPTAGIARDVQTPSELLRLRLMKKLAEANGLLDEAEKAEIDALERQYETLLKGGYVGTLRRGIRGL